MCRPASCATGSDLEHRLTAFAQGGKITQALVLGGGAPQPLGIYDAAIQLLETGLFEDRGIGKIGMAGHPEGNPDIIKARGEAALTEALKAKQAYLAAHGIAGLYRHTIPVRGRARRLLGEGSARCWRNAANPCRRTWPCDHQDARQICRHVWRRQFGALHSQAGAERHQAPDRVEPGHFCRKSGQAAF